jgi:DNA-binding transcriptional ArsR family regulator
MRQVSRKSILGLALLAAGLLLALVGVGASFGFEAARTEAPSAPAATAADAVSPGGLVADAGVDLNLLGVHQTPAAHLDPAPARGARLPTLAVDKQVGLPTGATLPVGLDARLALGTGRSAEREAPAGVGAASASFVQIPVLHPAATAALAAVAFAGAGLLAYFGGAIKKALWLPLVGLYAKISRAEVFENEVRERIFQMIKASPGLSASALAQAAGVAWGTTIYHLDVLEQTRMVTSIREGRHRRYFENGAQLTATKETVAVLCNPVTSQVAQRVKSTPGLTQKDLAQATGLSPQALHWHLVRLVKTGVVRKQREGRVVRHFSG